MAYTKLGRIRPVHKGNWSASTAYTALEMVRSGNVSYIANKDVPAGTPLNNGEYWAVVLDVSTVIADVEASADSANQAAANANAVMDVKANALAASVTGNPVQFYPDESSVIKPVLTFEPIQEGSGDPYPAGATGNILPPAVAGTKSSNGITVVSDGNGNYSLSGTATAVTSIVFELKEEFYTEEASLYIHLGNSKGVGNLNVSLRESESGANVTYVSAYPANRITSVSSTQGKKIKYICFFTSAADVAVDGLQISPMYRTDDAAVEFTPYANIRPFVGRTGAELVRCGKNLLSFMVKGKTFSANGMTGEVTDAGMVINGTPSKEYAHLYHERIYLEPGTYTLSGNSLDDSIYTQMYIIRSDGTDKYFDDESLDISGNETEIYVMIQANNSPPVTVTNYIVKAQLELGSTASTFVPYHGDTYALDFGQTVYGGTLDWNEGLATSGMSYIAFDGTEPFGDAGDAYFLNASYAPGIELGFLNANPNAVALCSHFTQGNGGINDPNSIGKFDLGGSIRFNKSGFATVDDFKAHLAAQYAAGTPVQLVYTLATPITIQLTPQQITALAGVNTVYGDADGMTVNYNKDLATAFAEVWAKLNG